MLKMLNMNLTLTTINKYARVLILVGESKERMNQGNGNSEPNVYCRFFRRINFVRLPKISYGGYGCPPFPRCSGDRFLSGTMKKEETILKNLFINFSGGIIL